MPFAFASLLLLLGQTASPPLPNEQLGDLIRAKSAPLKSLVFVYDGSDRWIGDPKQDDARQRDRSYQGTFLYRSDGAALCDVYTTSLYHGGVIRKKSSVLNHKLELIENLLDAKQKLEPENIQRYPGTLSSLQVHDAPLELFPLWGLGELIDSPYAEVAVEGWDVVAGRTCLRVRACTFINDKDHERERDKRSYWLDLERNAQAVKVEFYRYGNLETRIEPIELVERSLGDKTSSWLPVSARIRAFNFDGTRTRYSKEPLYERTIEVVAGSERINVSLPDALFTVNRKAAYPTPEELKGVEARAAAGPLAREFQAKIPAPPPEPYRTDPVSVRKRIEDGLAEADRQAKELEASSPARQAWSGTTVAQVAVGVVGVALLGFVAVKKWRGG